MELRTLSLAALALSSVALAGCTDSAARDAYPLPAARFMIGEKEVKLDDKDAVEKNIRGQVASVLALYFGAPDAPRSPFTEGVADEQIKLALTSPLAADADQDSPLVRGRKLYKAHCVHCHGLYGAGDGPTANFLLPKPRNFLMGELKFTSTKPDTKPTLSDIKRTIAQGINGTMMPAFGKAEGHPELGIVAGFAGPPGFDVDATAQYVRVLLMRGESERKLIATYDNDGSLEPDAVKGLIEGVIAAWRGADEGTVKAEAPRPARDPAALAASIKRGDELFHTAAAQCVSCHGAQGLGDGLDADVSKRNKDVWGSPLRPANLTLGVYRGGRRPIDLYRRIHAGVKGNVMPGFGAQLKPEEIWNLVDYVQALGLPTKP